MSGSVRDRLRAFTKSWKAEAGSHRAFEAGTTEAKAGIYNTRQFARDGLKSGRLNVGPKLTVFEGAKLNTLQIMGAQELPHRDRQRFLPKARAGTAAPIQLPSLSPGVSRKVAYAKGAQPAFFKIISGAAGGTRVGALFTYLGTRDDPDRPGSRMDIEITTNDGRVADTEAGRSELLGEWSELFRPSAPARDVYRIAIGLNAATPFNATSARELIADAVGERRFVFAVRDHGQGHQTLHVAVATSDREKRGRDAGDVLRGFYDALNDAASIRGANVTFSSREASGHAFAGIKHQLDRFKTGDFGLAFDDVGIALEATSTGKLAAAWTKAIGRGRAKDVIHTVFSARPGTERQAFQRAVMATLDDSFAGFRHAVASHDDKSHVHVHAVIQTTNRAGERLTLYKADLEAIRETMAQRAREQGINMVHVTRDDLASARGYSKEDAAAVKAGKAGPGATARYQAKASETPSVATNPKQAARREQAAKEWAEAAAHLARENPQDRAAVQTAKDMMHKHGAVGYKSTRNRKFTILEQGELIFKGANEAMMDATTETALHKATTTAMNRIDKLAAMAKPADAAKLREQGHELQKLAAAQAELIRVKGAERAAEQAARAAGGSSNTEGQAAQKELSRQAEALRRAAITADREASAQNPVAGVVSADPTDQKIHKIAEQERALARQALEKAERDGKSADEIDRLRKAYHNTLDQKNGKDRDTEKGPTM